MDFFFSSSELDEVAGGGGDEGEIRQTTCCPLYDEITPFLIRSYRAYFRWRDTGKGDVWWLCAIKATLKDGDGTSHCRNVSLQERYRRLFPSRRRQMDSTGVKTRIQILFFLIKDFYFSFYRLFVTTKSVRASCLFFSISLYCSNAVLKQPRKNQRLIRSV